MILVLSCPDARNHPDLWLMNTLPHRRGKKGLVTVIDPLTFAVLVCIGGAFEDDTKISSPRLVSA